MIAPPPTRSRHPRVIGLLIGVVACLGVLPATALGATFTVTTTSDNPVAAGCDAAECTLREAMAAAGLAPGADTVVFRKGVSGTITLTQGELNTNTELTIIGPGATRLAVSGNDTTRVLSGGFSPVEVRGLTLTRGKALSSGLGGGEGGAVLADRLTLRESRVTSSFAEEDGGGIQVRTSLALIDSRVERNSAGDEGGGIWSQAVAEVGGSLTVDRSVVSANSADRGAGILSHGDGPQTVKRSQVRDNTGGVAGGGIHVGSADATLLQNSGGFALEDSQVTANTAQGGAGLFNLDGSVTVKRSVLRHNTAAQNGGGIFNLRTLTLERSGVIQNTATEHGGGVYNFLFEATADIKSSLIASNTASSGGGLVNGGATVTLDDSIVTLNRARGGGASSLTAGRAGGIWSFGLGATLTATNTGVLGNRAVADGGGVYNADGAVADFTDSQVRRNRADTDGDAVGTGGGIFNTLATFTLTNTPVLQNKPNNCAGDPTAPPC